MVIPPTKTIDILKYLENYLYEEKKMNVAISKVFPKKKTLLKNTCA